MAETLYEHAGGDEGLHRLEELFYTKALADPVLRAQFTQRMPAHVDHLTWFTAESFGDAIPPASSGFQYIIDVHRHLKITDEQRERFIAVYLETLDEGRAARRRAVPAGGQGARRVRLARGPAELLGQKRRRPAPDPCGPGLELA